MAPQTESTRVVIVRPTRDGDHIIINVTFGKLWLVFKLTLRQCGLGHKIAAYTGFRLARPDKQLFSARMSVYRLNFEDF